MKMTIIINELLCFTKFYIVGADSINLPSIMNSINEFYSNTDIETAKHILITHLDTLSLKSD